MKTTKQLFKELDELEEDIQDGLSNHRLISSQLKSLQSKLFREKQSQKTKDKSLAIIKRVALDTQKNLEVHISDMVAAGLCSVFDIPCGFSVDFVERRGRTECDLYLVKQGALVDPIAFSGLGEADVAAFSLICASWSMENEKSGIRPTLILDEPFKHLKGEEHNIRVIKLMKTLSEELGIQIICVNDERAPRDEILRYSDKVFEVTQNLKGISHVNLIKE